MSGQHLAGDSNALGEYASAQYFVGMTGAAKSVIIADLLAQIGHRFGFRLIVEEGSSHAVLTQTQGCEPVIINPNGNISYRKVAKGGLQP